MGTNTEVNAMALGASLYVESTPSLRKPLCCAWELVSRNFGNDLHRVPANPLQAPEEDTCTRVQLLWPAVLSEVNQVFTVSQENQVTSGDLQQFKTLDYVCCPHLFGELLKELDKPEPSERRDEFRTPRKFADYAVAHTLGLKVETVNKYRKGKGPRRKGGDPFVPSKN